ncbi:MAG: hypothetical protein KA243_02300 [Candidatus Aminicenantes bacterium]|nr:hypothetical protein [Candidatus Aminicenantes bacterium]
MKKRNKEGIKKYLSNPWIIAIGGTALGTWVASWIVGKNLLREAIRLLGKVLRFLGNVLGSHISLPVWLLIIIALSIPAILILLISLLGSADKQSLQPAWKAYTKDTFDGITWRWQYRLNYEDKYDIESLLPFCPVCDCQLIMHGSSFNCPHCGFDKYNYNGKSEIELRLIIHHNLRQRYFPKESD